MPPRLLEKMRHWAALIAPSHTLYLMHHPELGAQGSGIPEALTRFAWKLLTT